MLRSTDTRHQRAFATEVRLVAAPICQCHNDVEAGVYERRSPLFGLFREPFFLELTQPQMMPDWSTADWIANIALIVAAIGVLLIIFAKWFR